LKIAGVAGKNFTTRGNVGKKSVRVPVRGRQPGGNSGSGVRRGDVVTKKIIAGGEEAVDVGIGGWGDIVAHKSDIGRVVGFAGLGNEAKELGATRSAPWGKSPRSAGVVKRDTRVG